MTARHLSAILGLSLGVSAGELRAQSVSCRPDDAEIYAAALRLFNPPRGQQRWIDPRLLSNQEPGSVDTASAQLDSAVLHQIHYHLADDFLPMALMPTKDANGGVIRVGTIKCDADDFAYLSVRYQHVTPTGKGPATDMELSVVRRGNKWVVEKP